MSEVSSTEFHHTIAAALAKTGDYSDALYYYLPLSLPGFAELQVTDYPSVFLADRPYTEQQRRTNASIGRTCLSFTTGFAPGEPDEAYTSFYSVAPEHLKEDHLASNAVKAAGIPITDTITVIDFREMIVVTNPLAVPQLAAAYEAMKALT